MHRFFVPDGAITIPTVTLSGPQAHQIARVLRLNPGDCIIVLDGSGYESEVELAAVSSQRVEGKVTKKALSQSEPKTEVTLYQGLLKGGKFEYVLQKCTEVGVTSFVPLVCRRCVADADRLSETKLARWRDIIKEAAEQSRRGKLPFLSAPLTLEQACKSTEGLRLLPWEGETATGLRPALGQAQGGKPPVKVSIFIGPEGGFEEAEVALARNCGVVPVTLGPRTLRAETSAVVAASLVLYEMGEMGR